MQLVQLTHRVRSPVCRCVFIRSAKSIGQSLHKTRHMSFPNLTPHLSQLSLTLRRASSQKTPAPQRYHNGRGRPRGSAPLSSSATPAVFPLSADFPLVQFSPTSALGGENDDSMAFVTVIPDMITLADERALLGDLDPVFGRKRYERGHWDAVIEDYKESERLDGSWSPRCRQLVANIRAFLAQCQEGSSASEHAASWLPVHAIDLSSNGFVRPHVDSVKFSGGVVAGLSLVSSAVMQLTRAADCDVAQLLLPPRSLYILRGPARFEWAHAILPNDGESIKWHGREFRRGRRVSLIFRDELVGPPPDPHPSSIAGTSGTTVCAGSTVLCPSCGSFHVWYGQIPRT